MNETSTYFRFINEGHIPFVGTSKQEIIDTLKYYRDERRQKIKIPDEKEILNFEHPYFFVSFPFSTESMIKATVAPKFEIGVNYNAVSYMEEIARSDIGQFKRGSLYKFNRHTGGGLIYIPECVIKGIQQYKWNQHKSAANFVNDLVDQELDKLKQEGIIRKK